ncbi:MAG: protoporphyrinogen oxidase [Ignavibacteriales bacterium]|nr:protoporphyrinogen oxidase [Ignavibacteriaceae bacterium]MCZ2144363.1 protoporphyrinogen oxidase [Ignavibacteriales bacterium]
MKKVIILGSGISGLAAAHWLHKAGIDFTILESRSVPGGSIRTEREGGYLFDFGPNSGLETTPFIREMVTDLGLDNEMIYANEASNKRYILKNGELLPLPMSVGGFLKTKLFSLRGKLRVLKEPFVGKSSDGYNQSLGEFVTRRLGKEFLENVIDPFVSGVFAGDPMKLSVKSAFPKLYRLEEVYGGLVKGMIGGAKERKAAKKRNEESKQSAKMFSFRSGLGVLPEKIVSQFPDKVVYNSRVKKISKTDGGWSVVYEKISSHAEINGAEKSGGEQAGDERVSKRAEIDGAEIRREEITVECSVLLSTLPAHDSAGVFEEFDPVLAQHFREIYHPPVKVLFVAFNRSDIGRALDGFGFLIPGKEKKIFLGAIWSSVIFENRCGDDRAAFTIFIGGAKNPDVFSRYGDRLDEEVISEFKKIMKIEKEPVFRKSVMWERAIPQYNLGYNLHDEYFEKTESENPGLFFSGNYRGGISIGDCFKNSKPTAEKIIEFLKK